MVDSRARVQLSPSPVKQIKYIVRSNQCFRFLKIKYENICLLLHSIVSLSIPHICVLSNLLNIRIKRLLKIKKLMPKTFASTQLGEKADGEVMI